MEYVITAVVLVAIGAFVWRQVKKSKGTGGSGGGVDRPGRGEHEKSIKRK